CVEFVAGEGKQVELEGLYVNRDLADGLHRVSVEVDVSVSSDAADLLKRLDGAEFVVGMHNGDENRSRADSIAQIVEIDQAIAVYGEIGNANTLFFKSLTGVEHCFVFDGGGDDVLGGGRRGVDHAEDCVIVRLR